jgi:thiol-disulfide isomerase/thioredoxin
MSVEENRMEPQPVLLSCTGCRDVLDERVEPPHWCSTSDYMARSLTIVDDFMLLESYCPSCRLAYEQLMQYGRTEIPLCP